MDTNTCLYYLHLISSKKIPIPIISQLFKEYGSSNAIIELPSSTLEGLGFSKPQIETLQSSVTKRDSQRNSYEVLEWAESDRNHLICYESEHYPSLLREIDSSPPLLFVKGSIEALNERYFAIVGSRKATIYGKKNAYWMAQELSKAGLLICSGMASGVDSKAHEGALDSGVKTIAVMGTGIDRVYPSINKNLAQRIVENGALISEFPLNTPPYPSNFPRRNRIISGLASGTLVIEASLKSGSLITARLAMEQNRDVFALPGPIANPQSRGCHALIKQGAKLVEEPLDVLQELDITEHRSNTTQMQLGNPKPRKFYDPVTELEAYKVIDHQGCLFQSIQAECDLDIQQLNGQLIELEAAGLIRQEGGRYFRLS